ncbi:MAG: hypothetical protein JWM82_3021, partial [Myxococcales bacterium]|nr:hypothetical protein [Myxococcales bacterium]
MDPLDELFSTTLEAFVATRERLAGELTRADKKGEGQALKKIRRPSPSAWATNQVVRRSRAVVDAVLDAAAGLRHTQDALLDGHAGQAKYQAEVEALRVATAALSKATREALAAAGRADERQLVERVAANVRAAASSPERGAALLAARLTEDLAVDDTLFGSPPAGASPPPPPRPVGGDAPKRLAAEQRQAEHARALAEAVADEAEARDVAARA